MVREKLHAGYAVRRMRRRAGLSQAAMAEVLAISPSYLNLIERNQRPLPSSLLVQLADRFDFDPRALAAGEPGGGIDAMRRRLADPLFADLDIDRHELAEWLSAAPGGAEAFARVFDRAGRVGGTAVADDDHLAPLRREIERWRNHFPDLDAAAEATADEIRLVGADLYGALVERLRVRHGLGVRVLPADVLPGSVRRLDLHARQVQLSEMLAAPGRTFALAVQLAQLEARGEIDALVRGAGLPDRAVERLFRRHLQGYYAAALMMPYARFLRACETTGYDTDVLEHRFGASFEQVAHRLTTLQRVGGRGLSFFMVRIDRAGQVSKRYAGASGALLVETNERCPLWRVHHAFDRPGSLFVQLVELEDGARWFTISRAAASRGGVRDPNQRDVAPEFAIGLGVAADQAAVMAAARRIDLTGPATPIGLGCRACLRPDCAQRSIPPASRALLVDDRGQSGSPFSFVED